MKNILYLIIVLQILSSCSKKGYKSYSIEMKKNLELMFKKDQELQSYDTNRLEDKIYTDSVEYELEKLCKENTKIIKTYFITHGFPVLKKNDSITAQLFWLIIQHSDHDTPFQKQVLFAMKKELKNKNIIKRNYAYLYDRVMKNLNKKQKFGTQIEWIDNKPYPYKLKHPKKVNKLREKMDLESVENYLKRINPKD